MLICIRSSISCKYIYYTTDWWLCIPILCTGCAHICTAQHTGIIVCIIFILYVYTYVRNLWIVQVDIWEVKDRRSKYFGRFLYTPLLVDYAQNFAYYSILLFPQIMPVMFVRLPNILKLPIIPLLGRRKRYGTGSPTSRPKSSHLRSACMHVDLLRM